MGGTFVVDNSSSCGTIRSILAEYVKFMDHYHLTKYDVDRLRNAEIIRIFICQPLIHGVVSNISQCQIALICATARARSCKVSCAAFYLIFISLVTLRLGS